MNDEDGGWYVWECVMDGVWDLGLGSGVWLCYFEWFWWMFFCCFWGEDFLFFYCMRFESFLC